MNYSLEVGKELFTVKRLTRYSYGDISVDNHSRFLGIITAIVVIFIVGKCDYELHFEIENGERPSDYYPCSQLVGSEPAPNYEEEVYIAIQNVNF